MKFTKDQTVPIIVLVLLVVAFVLTFNDVEKRNVIVLLAMIDQVFITKDWLHLSQKGVMYFICFIICVGAVSLFVF